MSATNKKEVLAQLATNNTKLTNLATTQFVHTKQLLKARPSTSSVAPNPFNGKNFVFQLRHTLKSKWVSGTFCSTHGWGASHSSPSCPRKPQGNIDTATRANPSGPGLNRNKG